MSLSHSLEFIHMCIVCLIHLFFCVSVTWHRFQIARGTTVVSLFFANNALFSLCLVIYSCSFEIRTLKFDAKMDKDWEICCLSADAKLKFQWISQKKCWQFYAFSWGFFSVKFVSIVVIIRLLELWNRKLFRHNNFIRSWWHAHVFSLSFFHTCVFRAMNNFNEIVKFQTISCATNWEKLIERVRSLVCNIYEKIWLVNFIWLFN